MIKIYKYGEVSNSEIFARENIAHDVEGIVSDIIATVIKNKDAALLDYTERFDKVSLRLYLGSVSFVYLFVNLSRLQHLFAYVHRSR